VLTRHVSHRQDPGAVGLRVTLQSRLWPPPRTTKLVGARSLPKASVQSASEQASDANDQQPVTSNQQYHPANRDEAHHATSNPVQILIQT
jgi:hypothetical protein